MGKQWVRQQVKRNEIQDVIDSGVRWVGKNRQLAAATVGGTILALAILGLILYRAHAMKQEAWSRLSLAQSYAYMGKTDEALKQLDQLSQDYGQTEASGFAALFAGDVHYRQGQYPEAITAYAKILELGPVSIQPFALSNTASSYEAAGKFEQAAAQSQSFLDAHADHFLAPHTHSILARSLAAMGKTQEARVALQKITLQYPNTAWANWATERLGGK
jgi:tetratricopeptide (TPR) repeat protein